MTVVKAIWNEYQLKIVKECWGAHCPYDVLLMVTLYTMLYSISKGRRYTQTPSLGGVYYQAVALGVASQEDYDKFNEERTLSRRVKKSIREKVFERDGNVCLVCKSAKNLQLDHIKPVFLGGSGDPDNLQTLCKRCHKAKGVQNVDLRHLSGLPPHTPAIIDPIHAVNISIEFIGAMHKLRDMDSWKSHNHGFDPEMFYVPLVMSFLEEL